MTAVHSSGGDCPQSEPSHALFNRLSYRPDIDGLRAVAVMAVIWFHFGLPGIPGGFLGVDVFFVISGYLIAGIILRELDTGSFSFITFYQRRVRRIAPALLVVQLSVLSLGWLMLLPRQLSELGRSAIATLFLVPNFHFWLDGSSDYFAVAKRLPPLLLHFWSLGVEEQFYLFFPAFLFVARRLQVTKGAVILVFASSFGLYLLGNIYAPKATFYMFPTRAWELSLGVVLSLGIFTVPKRLIDWSNAIGLLLLAAALGSPLLNETFQSAVTIAAATGTALLIASGPGSRVSRLLSVRPLAGLGLISYSLYLWHWPVLLLLRQWLVSNSLPPIWTVVALALSGTLASLTWRYVERPARLSTVPFRTLFAGVAIGFATVLMISIAYVHTDGWPARFDPKTLALADQARDYVPLMQGCEDAPLGELTHRCRVGSGVPTAAIWGDSHAVASSAGIADALGQTVIVASTGGCAPSLGVAASLPGSAGQGLCGAHNRAVLNWLRQQPQISTIFLIAYWPKYVERAGPTYWQGIETTVNALRPRRVIIITGIPDPGVNVPLANVMLRHFKRSPLRLNCPTAGRKFRHAENVDLSSAFCAHPRPWLLFIDSNHPSLTANKEVIAPTLRAVLARNESGDKAVR